MRKVWISHFVFVAAGSLVGCVEMAPPGLDAEPPAIVEMHPTGEGVELEPVIDLKFTEPVVLGEHDGLVVLLPSELLTAQILADLDKPPLSDKHAGRCVPSIVEISGDGKTVSLRPAERLAPGTWYAVAVSAAVCDRAGNCLVDRPGLDDAGRPSGVAGHWVGEFRTKDFGPRITEIMINPAGPESAGEYVELVNYSAEPVDLSGWAFDDSSGTRPSETLGPCTRGGRTVVEPEAVALLVGRGFEPPEGLGEDVVLLCGTGDAIGDRGLRNSGGEVLRLLDPGGAIVDSYGGWFDMSEHEGCSVERIDPYEPDGQDNWYVSDGDPCSSPGAPPP